MLNIIEGTVREMLTRFGLFVLPFMVMMPILACINEGRGTDTVPSAESTATVPISNESSDLVVSLTPTATPTQIPEAKQPVETPTPEVIVEVHASLPENPGFVTMDERILRSDVIARATMNSVSADAEYLSLSDTYASMLKFRFDVHEYLKGSGDDTLTVGLTLGYRYNWAETEQEAIDTSNQWIAGDIPFPGSDYPGSDRWWDDREAIIFLKVDDDSNGGGVRGQTEQQSSQMHKFLPQNWWETEAYAFATSYGNNDTYSIESRANRVWLPSASQSGGGVSGASGSSEQLFLLGDIVEGMDNQPGQAVGAASQTSTDMSLSDLKSRISSVEDLLRQGDGIQGYEECLIRRFAWERIIFHPPEWHFSLDSGLPAGSVISRGGTNGEHPTDYDIYLFRGVDEHLFEFIIEDADQDARTGYHRTGITKRPLPEGRYEVEYHDLEPELLPCNFTPDHTYVKPGSYWTIYATAPEGVVHEAFFDPVDIGAAVGADSADGVLEPSSFSNITIQWDDSPWLALRRATFIKEDIDAAIHRIDWESGRVRMQLDPPSALTDHHIDFIDLDGSVSLRLDFDDAVSVSEGNAGDVLIWGVCEQPWQSGDLLMLRISRSEPGLTDATNDAECAAAEDATPTPEAIPTATPTVEPDATPTATATPMSETAPSPTATTIPVTEPAQTATPAPVALTPPSKPLNLTASTQDNSITLTWDDPDDNTITGYLIFRRLPNIDRQFTLIADTTGMPAFSYTDTTGIEQGKRYLYRVRAINNAGQSAASDPAVVETASLLPAAPQNLSAEATHNTVTLSWDGLDVSITGYQILRRVAADPAGFMVIVEDTGTSESEYVDAVGVEPATHYIYRIVGINDEGLGKPSQPVQAMTLELPAAPTVAPTPTVMPTATSTQTPTPTPKPDDGVSGAIDTPTPVPTPEPNDGVSGAIDPPTPTPTPEPDDGITGAADAPTPMPTPEPDDGVSGASSAPTPTPTP